MYSLRRAGRSTLDDYTCQVCGFRFTDRYGELGEAFAKAHHLDAIGKAGGPVITSVDDFSTVCANFHRMLHKMTGERSDIDTLKKLTSARRAGAGPPRRPSH